MASVATKKVPEACIRMARDGTTSLCGRHIYASEFCFTDAAYALRHYTHNGTLRVCVSCVVYAPKGEAIQ